MKDQFVIAYLPELDKAEVVVSHACRLACMLNKGLILLYVEDSRYGGPSTQEAEAELLRIEARIAPTLPSAPAHVAMRGNSREVVDALPTLLNGVVAVAAVDIHAHPNRPTHPKQVLRTFAGCKIAYLTVQLPLPNGEDYPKVAYSIDFNKESKEKLIWASYFARFGKSRLYMLHQPYNDAGLRGKWNNNVRFMDKFFADLGVQYERMPVQGRALFPETLICQAAAQSGCNLLISVTTGTRNRDVLEWFAGVQEDRTVRNPHSLPVLFINPRNDIYVLCD